MVTETVGRRRLVLRILILFLALGLGSGLAALVLGTAVANRTVPGEENTVVRDNWPMFHHDSQHSGVVAAVPGSIVNSVGPSVRWRYQVAIIPSSQVSTTRWTSTFPLGDLTGDGTLEVVVTSPGMNGQHNLIMALEDRPGQIPPVHRSWVYTASSTVDMYSPVLVRVNDDKLLDVVFSEGNGTVHALAGNSGLPLWEYATGRITEAGPTAGNLDGLGGDEVVIVTAYSGNCAEEPARLVVLPALASGTNTPQWEITYPAKLDSSVPALADLDPNDGLSRLAVVAGTWGGDLLVTWQRPDGLIVVDKFDLRQLDPAAAHGATPAVRSSPLIWDFDSGPTAVFGWVLDPKNPREARISAIRLQADMVNGTAVQFTPLWTEPYAAWKSSVTLLPVTDPPLIAAGYGLAVAPGNDSGGVGECFADRVFGGIVALRADGSLAWQKDYGHQEGNVRASAAVADIDGDRELEIILPFGCYGRLHAYDGATGAEEWQLQLGPRAQNSPSIGDLDGDGSVEIVVGSYDGYVWVLGGAKRTYLPAIKS